MIEAYIAEYLLLLIKQYYDKPNARAEIEAMLQEWALIYELYKSFPPAFDVDIATGDRLDKIGKIVGINRSIPNILPKNRFTFEDDPTGAGFGSLFNEAFGAPFISLFEEPLTDLQLDDFDFRFFIKAKIAVNQGSAYLVSDEYTSIQDVIELLFNGDGYVLDNYDMTLTLYVPYGIPKDRFNLIQKLNLLPKPQGVRYRLFFNGEVDSFGFEDDIGARGFGSLFDEEVGGSFASIYN